MLQCTTHGLATKRRISWCLKHQICLKRLWFYDFLEILLEYCEKKLCLSMGIVYINTYINGNGSVWKELKNSSGPFSEGSHLPAVITVLLHLLIFFFFIVKETVNFMVSLSLLIFFCSFWSCIELNIYVYNWLPLIRCLFYWGIFSKVYCEY